MKFFKIITILSLAFLISCGQAERSAISSNSNYSSNKTANAAANTIPDIIPNKRVGGGGGGGKEEQTVQTQVSLEDADKSKAEVIPTDHKIIRNAELTLEANSPEESQQKITAIAESKGGFVVESEQSSSNSTVTIRDIVTMTVRVPSAKFSESLEEIRKNSNRVIIETVKGQDVTEEFVDIEASLKTKKALEEKFLEIMKQSKTVEEALNVQRELADVRNEIEKIEGRKRFLENQTSLSTIKIRLQTPNNYSPNSTGFFYQLGEAFSNGFNFALNFILSLITFIIAILPFVLFVILPIALVIRYFLNKQKKKLQARKIIEEELKSE
jgi:hypothetical protein